MNTLAIVHNLVEARLTVDRPRTFYRGTEPGDQRKISTGTDFDRHLFMSSDKNSARMYGRSVQKYEAAPDAKIAYEGTREFHKVAGRWKKGENLLQFAQRATNAAKAAGYHAVHFKRQGDVGTAVFAPEKFHPVGEPEVFKHHSGPE